MLGRSNKYEKIPDYDKNSYTRGPKNVQKNQGTNLDKELNSVEMANNNRISPHGALTMT